MLKKKKAKRGRRADLAKQCRLVLKRHVQVGLRKRDERSHYYYYYYCMLLPVHMKNCCNVSVRSSLVSPAVNFFIFYYLICLAKSHHQKKHATYILPDPRTSPLSQDGIVKPFFLFGESPRSCCLPFFFCLWRSSDQQFDHLYWRPLHNSPRSKPSPPPLMPIHGQDQQHRLIQSVFPPRVGNSM